MSHYHFYPILPHSSIFYFLFLLIISSTTIWAGPGPQWQLLQPSIGISAMHMQLLSNDKVIIFDRTDFGPSNISLPANHSCRFDPLDQALTTDCTAHSVEYDPIANTFRPLTILTDTWCSSGSVLPSGRLVQTGGYNDGDHVIRTFDPCSGGSHDACDWVELQSRLLARRWYATNHILPDGRIVIIGGRRQFNYEFFPKTTSFDLFELPFLVQTYERGVENNLYPFVFLHVDGNLFIFANNKAILFDYKKNSVVRTYPDIPGGDPRNYPSTGSGVLLPLSVSDPNPEVLICGGAPKGSFLNADRRGQFVPALNTCARMKISDPNPIWVVETMPMSRTMGDMVLLPDGNVLIINGCGSGTAGWELGRDPVLSPVTYCPDCKTGSRFQVLDPTQIPRMYHSTAILLRDGRVLVGGSNPHKLYKFTNVLYPTQLSLEAFSPPYLDPTRKPGHRSIIRAPMKYSKVKYNSILRIKFHLKGEFDSNSMKITMIMPPFTTHSFSMNQRMLALTHEKPVEKVFHNLYEVMVTTPGSANIGPPGFYMLFVVHKEVPSEGMWVQLVA